MGPKYVLHYFNVTGRAEAIRLLFHVGEVEFEDKQYTFQEWPEIKGDCSRFPLNQMPTLQIDGHVVCQSLAIIRYLATEFGLYGANNEEKLISDQIIETLNDVFNNATTKITFNPALNKEEKKAAFAEYFEGTAKSITFVMKLVNQTEGKFCFGNKVALPDLLLFSGYEFINSAYPALLEKYPDLVTLVGHVMEVDNIKKYLSTRKHAGLN